MNLYEKLAPLYDRLFPIDSKASPFLDSVRSREGRARGLRALDAGCATGTHAHGPRRMDSLLGDAGFRKPIRYSGWDGRPFDESRDVYCITVAAS